MPSCKCPGESLVGSVSGLSGSGRGQSKKNACINAYEDSGLLDAYYMLMKAAFRWECEGNCQIRTRYSIEPGPTFRQDANGIWHADLDDTTLKVWVECIEPIRA